MCVQFEALSEKRARNCVTRYCKRGFCAGPTSQSNVGQAGGEKDFTGTNVVEEAADGRFKLAAPYLAMLYYNR